MLAVKIGLRCRRLLVRLSLLLLPALADGMAATLVTKS